METIKDIARICGVGVSTVSRAINNHPDINPETKEMVMRVIKEHNYICLLYTSCTNCTKYVRKNCEKLQNLNSGIAIMMWQVYI